MKLGYLLCGKLRRNRKSVCFVLVGLGLIYIINISSPADVRHGIQTPGRLWAAFRGVSRLDPLSQPLSDAFYCPQMVAAARKEPVCAYQPWEDDMFPGALKKRPAWDDDIVFAIADLLERDQQLDFIDLGAGLGLCTIAAASLRRRVVSVEPYAPNLQRLAQSLRLSPHLLPYVTVITDVLSDGYRLLDVWRRERSPSSPIFSKLAPNDTDYAIDGDTRLKTIKVDDILPFIPFRIAAMHISLGGDTWRVLYGARRFFRTVFVTHIFMEWTPDMHKDMDHIILFFINHMFNAYRQTGPMGQYKPLLPLTTKGTRIWPRYVLWAKADDIAQGEDY